MAKGKKVILQALMGLDIGGAETHVVELSIELKRRGYRVIVASNGGVYESVLREKGVETVTVPLHTKNPMAVLKSIKILYSLIKDEDIKLVHGHARIPAFLVSLLQKVLDFNMITTAHGVFHVNLILKHITRWGDRVFVVSEDIRKYIKENYNFSEDRIYNTINGINLDRFKPSDNRDKKSIVHISRLENNTSLIAKYLIEYGKNNRNQSIVIVGDGEELNNLKELAKGLDNITFTGKSSDVNKYLDNAKIFVGISRAALEAMCYNLPIILGGDYGYMGILNEEKLKQAEFNNFTARDTELTTYEALSRDLDILLNTAEEVDYSWERQYIEKNYSVEKMVDKYEEVYRFYLED